MSKEHNISQIAAQTAYMKTQHDLKLAEIKRLEDLIISVTKKTKKINEKFNDIGGKKNNYKTKQKEALCDRERQLLSNEYLNQSVVDLGDQALSLEISITGLENHCNENINKNKNKLLELRKTFNNVPSMVELTKIQIEDEKLSKENEKYNKEMSELQKQIDNLCIVQKRETKVKIIALLTYTKSKWNLENLPTKIEEYLEKLRKQTEKEKKDSMNNSYPMQFNNVPRAACISHVDVNDLDKLFSFTTPDVKAIPRASIQKEKIACSTLDANNNTSNAIIKSKTPRGHGEGKQNAFPISEHSQSVVPTVNHGGRNKTRKGKFPLEDHDNTTSEVQSNEKIEYQRGESNKKTTRRPNQYRNSSDNVTTIQHSRRQTDQKQKETPRPLQVNAPALSYSDKVTTNHNKVSQRADPGSKVKNGKTSIQKAQCRGADKRNIKSATDTKNKRPTIESAPRDSPTIESAPRDSPTIESTRRNIFPLVGDVSVVQVEVHAQSREKKGDSQDLRQRNPVANRQENGVDNEQYTASRSSNGERGARKNNSQSAGLPVPSASPSKKLKLHPGLKDQEENRISEVTTTMDEDFDEQDQVAIDQYIQHERGEYDQDERDEYDQDDGGRYDNNERSQYEQNGSGQYEQDGNGQYDQHGSRQNHEDGSNQYDQDRSGQYDDNEVNQTMETQRTNALTAEEEEKSKYFSNEEMLEEAPSSVFSLYDEDPDVGSSVMSDQYGDLSLFSDAEQSQGAFEGSMDMNASFLGQEGGDDNVAPHFFNFNNKGEASDKMFSFF